MKQQCKPPKIANLLTVVNEAIKAGQYVVSKHAWKRSRDRKITLPDAKHVVMTGRHEKNKDQWSDEFSTWKYAIRGRTRANRNARIVVSLDESSDDGLWVFITIINLDED